tara:strand:- start:372 stop:599 length:228 start_codon:yes stop_codon:yes gene_type:complete
LQFLELLTGIQFGFKGHQQNFTGAEVCSFCLANTFFHTYGVQQNYSLEIFFFKDSSPIEAEQGGLDILCWQRVAY